LKNNFLKRIVTSAVFVIILIGSSLWNSTSFFVLFFSITLLGMVEFYRITFKIDHKPQIILGIVLGLIVFTSIFLVASSKLGNAILLIYIPLIITIFIVELFRNKEDPFGNIAFTIFGSIYIAVPFGLLSYFVFNSQMGFQYNPFILITYFILIWANDSGAYLVGSAFGKHKLFERISPKKSWEGFVGGAIFSLITAYIASLLIVQIKLADWLAISAITFTFGTLGDLFESLLKRGSNVKDSGNILPGHGGILDRFDSLLLSAPIVFVYLKVFA